MVTPKLKIGISSRIVKSTNYNEKRDAISHDWPPFLEKINSNMVFIPNTLTHVEDFLNDFCINAIILSGGDDIGDDLERDVTEKKILDFAIKNKIPLFGVCRGMQVINKYFGGYLEKNYTSFHVGTPHDVDLINQNLKLKLNKNSLMVNSFHNNIITTSTLGKELEPFAITKKDQTIEGFFHKTLPIVGVMWHPERDPTHENQLILKEVFYEHLFWKE